MVEMICGTGKILAWSGTLKEGKQLRVVTVKSKNCYVRKEARARNRRSRRLIPDSREGDTAFNAPCVKVTNRTRDYVIVYE